MHAFFTLLYHIRLTDYNMNTSSTKQKYTMLPEKQKMQNIFIVSSKCLEF